MRTSFLACLVASSCADRPPPPEKPNDRPVVGPVCTGAAQCRIGEICMHGQCVEAPEDPASPLPLVPHLSATPERLEFGAVAAGQERRLAVVIANDGEAMLTVRRVTI